MQGKKTEGFGQQTKTYQKAKEEISIWRKEDPEAPAWELIRGSSYCAIKANVPNRFKEEDTNE